jgi:hypothetical protein
VKAIFKLREGTPAEAKKLRRGSSDARVAAQRINSRIQDPEGETSFGDVNDRRVQLRKLMLAGCWGKPLKRNLARGSELEGSRGDEGESRRECEKH